jgi:hypothetical protein
MQTRAPIITHRGDQLSFWEKLGYFVVGGLIGLGLHAWLSGVWYGVAVVSSLAIAEVAPAGSAIRALSAGVSAGMLLRPAIGATQTVGEYVGTAGGVAVGFLIYFGSLGLRIGSGGLVNLAPGGSLGETIDLGTGWLGY